MRLSKHTVTTAYWQALVVVGYITLSAASSANNWTPPPPKSVNSTWVQLVSGEWVKGDVISMYQDRLHFDSDKLGVLSIKWGDIVTIHASGEFGIFTETDGKVIGQLDRIGDKVVIASSDSQRIYDAFDVVSIAPREERAFSQWSAKVSLGYSVRQGNNDESEFNASADIKRQTANTRATIDYLGYMSVKDDSQTANNHRLKGVYDRFVSRKFFWRTFQGELFIDKFQNIERRTTVGSGFGYRLIENDTTDWDISTTLGYQITRFDSVEVGQQDDERTPALTASTVYDTELTHWIDWKTSMQLMIVNEVSGRYTHHLVSTISTEITKYIDFDVSVVWDRTDNPRADADGVIPEKDDYRMVVGIGIDY
ncbi:DUF481 domain-containing protein [Neiella sp. HB171785]|uniref:DUF481 domain-containing protein n=1 Tax=Neiella litorisoli TaxID=2771431 RepID=A0A8J6QJP9_9GAMM|nr:DUF481 domain-containing protein [Neiella litorisoli]MBD1389592.1 DUF481 domain-containing protein [Neiella litorisoli]